MGWKFLEIAGLMLGADGAGDGAWDPKPVMSLTPQHRHIVDL